MSSNTLSRRASSILVIVFLIACSVLVLLPLYWALVTSFKVEQAIYQIPPQMFPNPFFLGNYGTRFFLVRFTRYLYNSFVVAVGTILLAEFVAFLAAYSASRFDFKGKNFILFILWTTIMIPGISVIVPIYMLSVRFGLYDTYWILILVFSAWLVPTMTWLFRGYINNIPPELEECAIIDGASVWKAMFVIVLPLARPGLAAAAVLALLQVWNDFVRSYALTISDSTRTVQAGLYHMMTDWGVEWGPMMAATVAALIPIVLAFVVLQRQFIQGLTSGSVKG